MFNFPPDTEPDPDEIDSLEDAKQFIEREQEKTLKQVRPLASQLEMQWANMASNIKK